MTKRTLKFFVIILVLAAIAAFFVFDLQRFLSLEFLKSQRDGLSTVYSNSPELVIGVYALVYIVVTALSLPGAAVLTLAGGAIFGLLVGVVVVSFASTIGATCAFLLARFLLRDYVQSKFRDRLGAINRGIQRDGAFYLFSLRLIPAVPFFVINVVMALTPISVITFFFVSQVGMLLGTAAYVNAGTQLAQISSLSGILSPGILLSFVIIGVVPFFAKGIVGILKARRVYAAYPRPKKFDYNMVVIGAGAAGLVSSYIAAAVKAKVALIEKSKMGGDCLNYGCVPSKALIQTAKVVNYGRRAQQFGLQSIDVSFDFAEIMRRVHRVIKTIEPHDSVERYSSLGVECITGEAKIRSPFCVEVNGRQLTTRNIVVASGAEPIVPAFPGLAQVPHVSTDNLWEVTQLPRRLVVLGGGPIGCELAQAFARLGSEVRVVEKLERLLIREDLDASEHLLKRFKAEGIQVHTGTSAKAFAKENGANVLIAEANGKEQRFEFDLVLFALGRRARVKGFGLEELGIELEQNGTIAVNEYLQTNKFPNIYVCGDVAGPYQFTHIASHQAWYCAVNALFSPLRRYKVDYRVIPWCTFTDPEIARVGLNESEAKAKGIPYEVAVYGIDDLDRAIADEEAEGFVKVLTVPGKDKILGVSIVAAHAGELIAEYIAAMKHGLGLNKIMSTIHIYPTHSEANKYAAGVWKKQHVPEGLLGYVAWFHRWRRG